MADKEGQTLEDKIFICSDKVLEWLALFAGDLSSPNHKENLQRSIRSKLHEHWIELSGQAIIELGEGAREYILLFDSQLSSEAEEEAYKNFPTVLDSILAKLLPVIFEAAIAGSLIPSMQRISEHCQPTIQQRRHESNQKIRARRWLKANFTKMWMEMLSKTFEHEEGKQWLGRPREFSRKYIHRRTLALIRKHGTQKSRIAWLFYKEKGRYEAAPKIERDKVLRRYSQLLKNQKLDYKEIVAEATEKSFTISSKD